MTIFHQMRILGRRFGVECLRANSYTIPERRIVSFLQQNNVDSVLNIGANDGEYASSILDAGYDGRVISFEPIPSVWGRLKERASKQSARWSVMPPVALSTFEGTAEFNVAGNLVSSSMFRMSASHVDAQPNSAIAETITVPVKKVDSYIDAIGDTSRAFMNVDVQGAEIDVLKGAERALSTIIVGVQVEMSIVPLYEGQALSNVVHEFLLSRGFELWDVLPGFRHSRTLRLLQYDGIYFR